MDTSPVVAGFGGGYLGGRLPRRRTATPAALRYPLIVSRRTPVAASMHRSDHPSRPSAITCCCVVSFKMLLMAGNSPLGTSRRAKPQLACGGWFSGVHWWPDLGFHRGLDDGNWTAAADALATVAEFESGRLPVPTLPYFGQSSPFWLCCSGGTADVELSALLCLMFGSPHASALTSGSIR